MELTAGPSNSHLHEAVEISTESTADESFVDPDKLEFTFEDSFSLSKEVSLDEMNESEGNNLFEKRNETVDFDTELYMDEAQEPTVNNDDDESQEPTLNKDDDDESELDEQDYEDLPDSYDPAHYCQRRILSTTINLLVDSPCQPGNEFVFPKHNGRQFLTSWFRIILPDETYQIRKWLSYSVSTNKAFCVDCMLFAGPTADDIWTRIGFEGWIDGHGVRGIERHESSKQHRDAEVSRFLWLNKCRIDQTISNRKNEIVEQNRRVVYVEIKAIKYLATEMIALRGHDSEGGKFLNLFKLIAEFEPSATAYLQWLEDIRSTVAGTRERSLLWIC